MSVRNTTQRRSSGVPHDRATEPADEPWATTRTILEAALDCIVVIDAGGHVVEWNPAAQETFGYSREQALGTELPELIVPPRLRAASRKALARCAATGEGSLLGRRIELPAVRSDGSELQVELTVTRADGDAPRFVGYLRDISDQLRKDAELEDAERRYRRLVERLPCVSYLAEYGAEGRWHYVSPQIQEMLGYTPQEWLAEERLWLSRVHPDDRERILAEEDRCAAEGLPFDLEYRMHARDGRLVWVRDAAAIGRRGADGQVEVEGLLTDITAQKLAEEELRYRANHDDLTDLFSRRRFEEELERYTSSSNGAGGAVLILDLDHLKFVNDSLGHDVGDGILRGVAATLRESVQEAEVIGRLGGDEFAVLLPEIDEEKSRARAIELLRLIRSRRGRVSVTASAGIALLDGASTMTAADVLVAADIALYEAKGLGRDRVAVSRVGAGERLEWVGRVRRTIREGGLALCSQPIIDVVSGKTIREELLVRMVGDRGELIPPRSWLPTAERFGLIRDVDRWAVSRAIRLAATGRPIAVNLSGRSIGDPGLIQLIERELRTSGADPDNVVFEITETAATTAIEELGEFAARIERLGCTLALDDFGTGFGSFTYLRHLPVRYLKIDVQFVRGLLDSIADAQIIRSIVAIARTIGMRTVAEGVEDDGTLEILRQCGVDYAQGFHLGRPTRVEDPRPSAAPSATDQLERGSSS